MVPLWKSRKFRLTLAVMLISAAGALAGEISWQSAIYTSVMAICVNVLGITAEDVASKSGGGIP